MSAPFNIMCFAWNAAGLRLCETMSQAKADQARKGFVAFATRKKPCLAPDFFEEIRTIIINRRASLVVMTTEDEDVSDTYFHSDLLPSAMSEIGYSLVKRDKQANVGNVASKIPLPRVPTGNPSGSALRISMYARNDVLPELIMEERFLERFFGNNGQIQATCRQDERISGAIASYVWHQVYGKFVFIATSFPAGLDSLKVGDGLDYESYRAASRSANKLCLISLLNRFVDNMEANSRPDHVFILGDLNFDIVVPNKRNIEVVTQLATNTTAANLRDLQKYDELRDSMKEAPLSGFKEGVSNEGPLFMPTWRLTRNRPAACSPTKDVSKVEPGCFESGESTAGGIGWHDRILYKENMTSHYITHCVEYNRLDIKNMVASNHAGVIGVYEMRAIS